MKISDCDHGDPMKVRWTWQGLRNSAEIDQAKRLRLSLIHKTKSLFQIYKCLSASIFIRFTVFLTLLFEWQVPEYIHQSSENDQHVNCFLIFFRVIDGRQLGTPINGRQLFHPSVAPRFEGSAASARGPFWKKGEGFADLWCRWEGSVQRIRSVQDASETYYIGLAWFSHLLGRGSHLLGSTPKVLQATKRRGGLCARSVSCCCFLKIIIEFLPFTLHH